MLTAAIVGGLIVAAGAIGASVIQHYSNKDLNEKAEKFEREKLDYQKYLNANQNQIQAADSLKAGINPIAMSGGSLTGYSGSPNYQSDDYSGIANAAASVGSTIISTRAQQAIADKQIAANAPYVQAAADKEQAQADLAKQEYDENYEQFEHNKKMRDTDLAIKQQELAIIRRKNQGQDQDGSYDGKPVTSESSSVKLGPVSLSKSSSGQSSGAGDYIRSSEYGKFVSDHIKKPNEWKNDGVVVDNSSKQNELQRYYDEGYIKLGTTKHNGRIYHLMCRARDKSYISISTPAGK